MRKFFISLMFFTTLSLYAADNKNLVLVEENHANISYEGVDYTLDSYIVMFEQPYYVTIERTDGKEITYEKAVEVSIYYIKPRGCTESIKRLPNLDKHNGNKTKWTIGLAC
jgi:hypothetical protein